MAALTKAEILILNHAFGNISAGVAQDYYCTSIYSSDFNTVIDLVEKGFLNLIDERSHNIKSFRLTDKGRKAIKRAL